MGLGVWMGAWVGGGGGEPWDRHTRTGIALDRRSPLLLAALGLVGSGEVYQRWQYVHGLVKVWANAPGSRRAFDNTLRSNERFWWSAVQTMARLPRVPQAMSLDGLG